MNELTAASMEVAMDRDQISNRGMNALYGICYVRPWNKEHLLSLAREIVPNGRVQSCSEHSSVDGLGLSRAYSSELNKAEWTAAEVMLSNEDIEDIVARCRLLRVLDGTEARRHLMAMAEAVIKLLSEERPDFVLSLTVDSFVIDLLRIVCKRMDIRFIGLVGCFLNGWFRVTARGESSQNPVPAVDELIAMKDKILDPGYSPSFNKKALANPRFGAMRRWVLNLMRIPYFFVRRHLSGDRYNYHYWSSEVVSRSHASLFPPRDPGTQEWKQRIECERRPKVFVPLQMFPECTIDYWCDDLKAIDYYARLEDFIASHHREMLVIVKEHPSVFPSRPPGFYARLARDPRVVVVPTYTHSNAVLAEVDGVLVWTGTVGFEAALRGKAVLSMASSYYIAGDRFLKIDSDTPTKDILAHMARCRSAEITEAQQLELLSHLGSQLYRGTFVNDGSWRATRDRDVRDLQTMASSLKPMLEGV